MGFERYGRIRGLDVPMYFLKRRRPIYRCVGQVVSAIIWAGKLHSRRARHHFRTGPTTSRRSSRRWRLKRYIEMRGSDGGPMAAAAGAAGVSGSASFMTTANLDACWGDREGLDRARKRQKLRDG